MTSVAGESEPRPGLKRALAWSSTGTVVARVLGALGGLLAARLLGPAGRGELAVVVLLATGVSYILAAGLQFWTARITASSGGIATPAPVVRFHLLVVTAVGVVVGALVAAVVAMSGGPTILVWMGLGIAVSNTYQIVLVALPTGVREMGVFALVVVSAAAVYVVVNSALLATDNRSLSLLLAGMTAGNLVSVLIIVWWLRRASRGRGEPQVGARRYVRALRFGFPAGASELVLFAMTRIDVLLVAVFLPLRDVGWYAVATSLAEMLWVVPDSVAIVVLPTTASQPGASRTTRLLRLSVALTVLAGLVLVVIAPRLTQALFGVPFVPAVDAVPLLAVASVAGAVWKIVAAEIVALGSSRPRLTSTALGLAVMVAIDVVAIPSMGIAGAALGSAVGYAVAACIVLRAWSSITETPIAMLLGAHGPCATPSQSAAASLEH